MNKYIMYWLDGKKENVEGNSFKEASTNAGYGIGALRALDFYSDNNDNYEWNQKTWVKK